MDGGDDGNSSSLQGLNDLHHMERIVAVQAGGRLVQKKEVWILDEFNANIDPLLLSA